jgi:hypothetical protein
MTASRKRRSGASKKSQKTKTVDPKVARSPILKVTVTSEIIESAIRGSSSHCMIADSIKAQYPKFTRVAVDLQTIRMTDPVKGLRYIYLTPRISQQGLVLFDEGKRIRSFQFTLRGAHTVSAQRINRQKGTPVHERIHNLGRRRIIPNGPRTTNVPDTVGGRAPPKHPSASTVREFGLRAFSKGDLEEVGL